MSAQVKIQIGDIFQHPKAGMCVSIDSSLQQLHSYKKNNLQQGDTQKKKRNHTSC